MHVVISRNNDEIHVSVPFAWKERAKKVKGYRWNPDLKVWIYPHARITLSQLIAEFGDDASVEGFDTKPTAPSAEPRIQQAILEKLRDLEGQLGAAIERAAALETANQALSNQLSESNHQLAAKTIELDNARKVKPSIEYWKRRAEENEKKFVDAIKASENATESEKLRLEVERLREQLAEKTEELTAEKKAKPNVEFWKRKNEDAERRLRELEVQQSVSPPRSPSIADPFLQLVQRCIVIAKGDQTYQRAVNDSTQSRLPLDLASMAETKLRALLKKGSRRETGEDFSSLIREAADGQQIGEETRVLLHFVRQNRNRVAHDRLDQGELWARSCLALLASAILWPSLELGGQAP